MASFMDRPKHQLLVTVGLPRSGKSTWARATNLPVVNPDAIRLAIHGRRFEPLTEPYVWAIAKTMVRALFLAGHETVVLDATNTTKKRRDEWRDAFWVTEFKLIDTPGAVCLMRARAAGDDDIVPVIERMALAFEPLEDGE